MEIISRQQWGARYPDGAVDRNGRPIVAPLPASEVWLHHSVTVAPDLLPPFDDDNAAMRTLENIGQQRFKQGISYTFAITPVGRVHHGHSPGRLGAHTGGRNSIARAICWIGNYDANRPTRELIVATANLLVLGKQRGYWREARLNGGHRQAPGASTACPGRYAMEAIPEINRLAAAGGAPLEDDMFTDEDRKALDWLVDAVNGDKFRHDDRKSLLAHNLIHYRDTAGALVANVAAVAAGGQQDPKALAAAIRAELGDDFARQVLAELGDLASAAADDKPA